MIEGFNKLVVMVTFLFAKVISLYVMEVESRQGIHQWFHFNPDDAMCDNIEQCFFFIQFLYYVSSEASLKIHSEN